MAILFPLKIGKFRLKHAQYVTLVGWIVCIFLSVLPTTGLPYFGDAFFGRTGKNNCLFHMILICKEHQVNYKTLAIHYVMLFAQGHV